MSLARIQRLEKWLGEKLQIPAENFDVSIEGGKVVAYFDDAERFTLAGDMVMNDDVGTFEFPITEASPVQNVGLRDNYPLVVVVRNHGEDPTRLKVGLLRWLYLEGKGGNAPTMSYDGVKNNQSTYDWFFDLPIEAVTRNVGAELRTC